MCNFLEEYQEILYNCEKPSRYTGGEFLSIDKNFDDKKVKMLLAFPDKYEIGISNFGHKILYHIINSTDDYMADRVYAPEEDFKKLLKENNKLLYGLDSKKPAKEFNLIAFGLQYELAFTTVLAMLEMSDIPVYSKDRIKEHPIIIAGGPCVFNPNPMVDFIDLFSIGDGEEVLVELCDIYDKNKNKSRDEILMEMAKIEGVYSPKFSKKVSKRVSPLKYEWHPTASPIPHFASIQDRAVVEIRRGCARLCRFCQSAHTNLPIRERDKEEIIDLVEKYVNNTGYDEYSLLSLSSNDHKDIEEILQKLNVTFKDKGINVSLPSQRADKFSLNLANLAGEVKKATITLAPEAGSQRMRDIINKGLTEEQIINAILASIKNGWNKIKLYFMIGLPKEKESDLMAMIKLLEKVNEKCREEGLKYPRITCSTSIFVPKPHTPFQWCGQNSLSEIDKKIDFLKENSKHLKNVRINIHNKRLSQIEAFLTRGDKNLCDFIYKMYKKGGYLQSWDENICFEEWIDIAKECNLDIEELATKEFSLDEVLPWDFIDCKLEKDFLKNGYQKAMQIE